MKIILSIALLFVPFTFDAFSQDGRIKRTTYKTDSFAFGVGGTIAISGAPTGSIKIEGWSKNEIEISAEIELEAANEADLAKLSSVVGFVLEESLGRTSITSIGPNDKKAMKKLDKKFPKHLIGVPFTINYVLKVPRYADLQINGGKGAIKVSGVEGVLRVSNLEGDADLELVGGSITATFGSGLVNVSIPTRSWRGRFAEISLARGDMNVNLPTGLSAYFDAEVLRSGKIENLFEAFVPRERKGEFTERSMVAKTGNGSVPLKFTVGDGNIKITEINKPS